MNTGQQKTKKPTNKSIKKVGKYIIDFNKKLGQGQFGLVYVAQNNQTKQTVACKTISKASIQQQDDYTKNALVRQIEIMKNLKSPNIIQFVEVIETPNNIYIFQQLANDGHLDKLLTTKKRFTEAQAIGYIIQILNGFSQLISHGIIHRDIKPTNILVKENVLKLADFGMSRYSSKSSAMHSYVGTPYYMAPQIIQEQKYSYKCDIWSLGTLFYELVVGTIPWSTKVNNTKSLLINIKQQCSRGIQFPSKLQISQSYKHLVRGCLKYKQQERFDWTQIFNHKIFLGKIKQINSNSYNFTMTELRKKIHSNNVNLQKLLLKMPQNLNKEDLSNILKALNQQISEKQIQNLFSSFSKGKDLVIKSKIIECFQDYGITRSCLKGKFNPLQQKNQIFVVLIEKISKNIEQKDINLFQLYKKFDKNRQDRLDLEQFTDLILNICQDIKKEDILIIFKHFNTQNTKSIPFHNFYQNFCKAVQIPAVKDSKVSEAIKKMQQRKKKQ